MRHLPVPLWCANAVKVPTPHFAFALRVALDHPGHYYHFLFLGFCFFFLFNIWKFLLLLLFFFSSFSFCLQHSLFRVILLLLEQKVKAFRHFSNGVTHGRLLRNLSGLFSHVTAETLCHFRWACVPVQCSPFYRVAQAACVSLLFVVVFELANTQQTTNNTHTTHIGWASRKRGQAVIFAAKEAGGVHFELLWVLVVCLMMFNIFF